MKRKIIKLGQATYVASIPTKWIKANNLDKGDLLEFEESEGNLIISTKTIVPRSKVILDLDDFNERTIRNILNQTYRKGFDVIKLMIKTPKQLEIIREIVRGTMLGFELVREEDDYCIVENIAEPSEDKYDVILRKLFLTIKQETVDIVKELEECKEYNMKKRLDNKNLVDNYTNFIRRLVIKYKIGGIKESYLLFYAVSMLSLVHHAYFYMYKYVVDTNKGKKISPDIIKILKDANKMFNTYYESFYKNDLLLAHDVQMMKKDLLTPKVYKLLEKSKGFENIVLYHTGEIIRMIQMSSTVSFGFVKEEK
jgi:phosphate uptake regulator